MAEWLKIMTEILRERRPGKYLNIFHLFCCTSICSIFDRSMLLPFIISSVCCCFSLCTSFVGPDNNKILFFTSHAINCQIAVTCQNLSRDLTAITCPVVKRLLQTRLKFWGIKGRLSASMPQVSCQKILCWSIDQIRYGLSVSVKLLGARPSSLLLQSK